MVKLSKLVESEMNSGNYMGATGGTLSVLLKLNPGGCVPVASL